MFNALMFWLMGWAKYLATVILNYGVDIINLAISAFALLAGMVAALLPSGGSMPSLPSVGENGGVFEILVISLNWLMPMQFMVNALEVIMASLIAYFVLAPVARWVKLLQ